VFWTALKLDCFAIHNCCNHGAGVVAISWACIKIFFHNLMDPIITTKLRSLKVAAT